MHNKNCPFHTDSPYFLTGGPRSFILYSVIKKWEIDYGNQFKHVPDPGSCGGCLFSGRLSEDENQAASEILHSGAGHRRHHFFYSELYIIHGRLVDLYPGHGDAELVYDAFLHQYRLHGQRAPYPKGGPSGHQNGPAGRHPHYHAEPYRHFPFPLFR